MDNIIDNQSEPKKVLGATDATQRARIFGNEDEEPTQSNALKPLAAAAITAFKNQLIDAMNKQIEKFKWDDLCDLMADYPAEDYDDDEGRMEDIQDGICEQAAEEMYGVIQEQSPY